VYEPLLNADSGEDIKAYAVGPNYCLALTRRSPVVSGDVVREANGKERRQITALTKEEAEAASKIAVGFGQALCGFDIVRNNGKSYVIDVNGWTSVKNQPDFYERSSDILRQMLISQLARENQGRKMQEHTS
jgi:glutathione synthase/RimK-type ligase-like ATP-grasp enzyme